MLMRMMMDLIVANMQVYMCEIMSDFRLENKEDALETGKINDFCLAFP